MDSPGACLRSQLARVLGRGEADIKNIRKTNESPPRVSVIDVVSALLGVHANNAAMTFWRLRDEHNELNSGCGDFQFPGRGQRKTPVMGVRSICELVMLLPGRHAARVRRQASELLTRFLGGDLAIVDEVCRNRGLQQHLAVEQPEHPRVPVVGTARFNDN